MNWTDRQRDAIFSSGNVIVSAAAGSGKTAVLTERIVRLISEGADMTDFLCVTFTNAAAGEMKKRVEKRLTELAFEIETNDGRDAAEHIYSAADDASRANISTMHSFCGRLLRRHFHSAGLDAAFRVADDAEIMVLKDEAASELLELRYNAEDNAFRLLIDGLGGEEAATGFILKLYEFMFSEPDPFGWLNDAVERYNDRGESFSDFVDSSAARITTSLAYELAALIDRLAAARDEIAEYIPDILGRLDNEIMSARGALLRGGYDEYLAALSSIAFEARFTFPRGTDAEVKKIVQDPRNALKKAVKSQIESLIGGVDKEADRVSACYPYMLELKASMEDFHRIYGALKAKRNVIDYSDMEHHTLSLLSSDERIRSEYKSRFKYIFVDEYQDTNAVQEAIVAYISRGNNVFTVGDVKQSIYGFRLADPELFISRYERFKATDGGTAIDLNSNFRSSNPVISAVNGIFSRTMSKDTAGVDYDADAALVAGRGDAVGAVEFHLIDIDAPMLSAAKDSEDTDSEDADGGSSERMDKVEAEAEAAARRIIYLMENESLYDSAAKETRPYRYSDFAVLLRSYKNIATVWTDVLSRNGIPAYAELSGGFFDAIEVRVLIDVLRVIDNAKQDIPLLSALRSPMGGFSANELAVLRYTYESDSLIGSLRAAAEGAPDSPLKEKCAAFLEKLEIWRFDSRLYGVEEFIHRLLDSTGYQSFILALPGGKERKANIDALAERARIYEKNGIRSLHDFIGFMDKLVLTGRLGASQTANSNVVRILTVHGSKGLEFPVVILGGLDRRFNMSDSRRWLVMDKEQGIGLKLKKDNLTFDTLYRRSIICSMEDRSLAEEMRVLYVALTRARERLIMLCASTDAKKLAERCAAPVTTARVKQARSMSDWILGAILNTRDGDPLRAALGIPVHPGSAGSIGVGAYYSSALRGASLDARISEEEFSKFRQEAAAADDSMFSTRFAWSYPHAADTLIPSKLSVTTLTERTVDLSREPDFIRERAVRATSIGTAAHALMQYISLNAHTVSSIEAELSRLVQEGLVDEECAALVRPRAIASFFASSVGERLIRSERVMRELEFTYRVRANELLGSEVGSDTYLLLQGVIDCCFIEDGEWVIVDYKTDYVPDGVSPYDAAKKHSHQLELYANALFALTKIPVREKFIFLLSIGEAVKL